MSLDIDQAQNKLQVNAVPSSVQATLNDCVLLDLLAEGVPDEATRTRILVDNPAALYGF